MGRDPAVQSDVNVVQEASLSVYVVTGGITAATLSSAMFSMISAAQYIQVE